MLGDPLAAHGPEFNTRLCSKGAAHDEHDRDEPDDGDADPDHTWPGRRSGLPLLALQSIYVSRTTTADSGASAPYSLERSIRWQSRAANISPSGSIRRMR